MTEHHNDLTRRRFIRKVGAGLVSITVVDLLFGIRPAFACGEGISDATCGGSAYNADENCGVSGDSDNNCGTNAQNSNDMSCGKSTSGYATAVPPNGTDSDEACMSASSDSDSNCGISYNPTPNVDVDNSCNTGGGDTDQSCGDCNDNHQTDNHCGEQLTGGGTDSDELCGHQHLLGQGTTDSVCNANVPDVGCGTHSNDYSPLLDWTDEDEYCSTTNEDRNCSATTSDSTCGASHSPSSTSPDENCSATDADEPCSLYDRDESCGNGNADEACGITTVQTPVGITMNITDNDANCTHPNDPDDSGGFPCPLGGG